MNKISKSNDFLVLDTVHGGDFLSKKLNEIGGSSEAIDPYKGEKKDPSEYEKIISPVHLDPEYSVIDEAEEEKILTHHDLVKNISEYKNLLKEVFCIEITGTVGKTSTALLLGKILKKNGYKVAINSSNGFKVSKGDSFEETEKFSISPAGNLRAFEYICNNEIDLDFFISEISLGFLGIADLAILTSLDYDYLIAAGNYKASEKKLNSVANLSNKCKLISPKEIEKNNSINYKEKVNYSFDGEFLDINSINLSKIDFSGFKLSLSLFRYFESSIMTSILASLLLKIPENEIKKAISSFTGFEGRMNKKTIKNRVLIDNSCSGTKIEDLDLLMDSIDNEAILIIGEEQKNICESFDVEKVRKKINEFDFKEVIGVGKKYAEVTKKCFKNHKKALKKAIEISNPKDYLISFVKIRR